MSRKSGKSIRMLGNMQKWYKRVMDYITKLEDSHETMTQQTLQCIKKLMKIIIECIKVSFSDFRVPLQKIVRLIAQLRKKSSDGIYVDVLEMMMNYFVDVILDGQKQWMSVRMILRCCIFVMNTLPDEVVKDIAICHMHKISLIRRCLRTAGEFRNQRVIMQFFFQFTNAMSKQELNQFAQMIFYQKELCYLRRVFSMSTYLSLEAKIRCVLNEYNDLLVNREIISFPVTHMTLGEIMCVPRKGETVWIDFNSQPMNVSIYCSSRFFNNDSEDRLTVIYIPVKAVSGFVTYHNNFEEDLYIISSERFKIVDVDSGEENMIFNICDIKITFFMHERNRDDGMAALQNIERIVIERNGGQSSLKFIKQNFMKMVTVKQDDDTVQRVQNIDFGITNQSFCSYTPMEISPVELSPIPQVPMAENHSGVSTERVEKTVLEIQDTVQKIKNFYQEIEKGDEDVHPTHEEIEKGDEDVHPTPEEIEKGDEDVHPTPEEIEKRDEEDSSPENTQFLGYTGLPSPRSSSSSDNEFTDEQPKISEKSTPTNEKSLEEFSQKNSERSASNRSGKEMEGKEAFESPMKKFCDRIYGQGIHKTTENSGNSQESASKDKKSDDEILSQMITQNNPFPEHSSSGNLDSSVNETLTKVSEVRKSRHPKKQWSLEHRISMLMAKRMMKDSFSLKKKSIKSTSSKTKSQKIPVREIKGNTSVDQMLKSDSVKNDASKTPRTCVAKKNPYRAAKSAKSYCEFSSSSQESIPDVTEYIEEFLQSQQDDEKIESVPEVTVGNIKDQNTLSGETSMTNPLDQEIDINPLESIYESIDEPHEDQLSTPRNCSIFEKENKRKRQQFLKSSGTGSKVPEMSLKHTEYNNLHQMKDKKISVSEEEVQVENAEKQVIEISSSESSQEFFQMPSFLDLSNSNSLGTFENEPIQETSKVPKNSTKNPASVPKKTRKKRKADELLNVPKASTKNSSSKKKRKGVEEPMKKDIYDFVQNKDDVPDFGKALDKLLHRDKGDKENDSKSMKNTIKNVRDANPVVSGKKRKLFNPQGNVPNEGVQVTKDEPSVKKYKFFKSRNSTPSDIVNDSEGSQSSEDREHLSKFQKMQRNIWKINTKAKKKGVKPMVEVWRRGRQRKETGPDYVMYDIRKRQGPKKISTPIVKRCLDYGIEAGKLVSNITPNRSSHMCSNTLQVS